MQPPAGGATPGSKDGPSSGPTAQRLYLSSLPPNIAKALAVYDTNFDGILGENEVALAAADMEHMQNIVEQEKEGKIPLDFFPEPVRKILCEFDANSDGELDVVEIMHGFEALKRERKRRRQLVWVLIGLLVFTVILLGAIGGLMAWIVESSKQTKINDTVMMVKGGAEAVRTSSAEYAVVDGVMMARGDPEQSCTDGTCSQPLKLSQALQTGALSSQVSDKDLEELRQMKIGNEGSWISFQVFAVARYQDADSEFGSIVAIYTHLGEIYLNGQEITFHESLEGAFTRAGFAVDGSRRRLLGVVEVLGLFNFLSQALSTSAIGNITTFLEGIPTYNGVISKFQYCETPVQDACKFVGPDGPWVNHVVDFNGGKALKQTEEQALYAIDGKPHSVTVVTSRQYAAQEKFLVRNETHLLKYQRHKNVNYFCEVEQDDGLKSVVAGATPAGEGVATNDIESEFLGEIDMVDTYGVVPCKYWKVEVKSTSFVLFYFETIDSPRMFQMNVSNYAYRFDSIEFGTSGLEFKTMKEAPSELDMQATLASCHPEGVIPPWKMKENELTNTILEDPAWGQRDTTPPVVQTPITNLNAAQAAALQLEYSTLTTAQWATECPDGAGAGVCAAVWCKKGTGGGAVIPGINFNHTEYEPCDPNNRRTGGTTSVQTVVALDFTDSPGTQDCTYEKIAGAGAGNSPTTYTVDCDCFEGSGTMTITRTCPADPCDAGAGSCSIQTSGSTSISFKTLQCFGSMFSTLANQAAGLLQASDADGVLDISSTLNTDDQFGEQVVGEFPADGAGSLCPATKFGNAGTVLAFDNLDNDGNPPSSTKSREFSDGTNLIMRVEASVTMDVLVVPITTCSAGQQAGGGFPTSNAQMGFRLGMSVQGNVVLNVAFSNGAWRYSNASPHIYTFSANRKIFPEPDGTLFCNRNANGVYHFKRSGTSSTSNIFWQDPVGLVSMGVPCQAACW